VDLLSPSNTGQRRGQFLDAQIPDTSRPGVQMLLKKARRWWTTHPLWWWTRDKSN